MGNKKTAVNFNITAHFFVQTSHVLCRSYITIIDEFLFRIFTKFIILNFGVSLPNFVHLWP